MIDNILQLLSISEFYAESENIDIAKGKYEMCTSLKDKKEQKKRSKAWQLKRR